MSRNKREGVLTSSIQDPLLQKLSEELDRCCSELGVLGCEQCPGTVRSKCFQLWLERSSNSKNLTLTLTDYRRFSQKFNRLKQERDQLLAAYKTA